MSGAKDKASAADSAVQKKQIEMGALRPIQTNLGPQSNVYIYISFAKNIISALNSADRLD